MQWDIEVDVVVVGGGGCGLTSALAAAESGLDVAILEKTEFVLGNTAASAGMIPAAGTRFQEEMNISDSPEKMANEILEKNKYTGDPEQTLRICEESASLVEWLVDQHDIKLSLVTEFLLPGHKTYRMHAPPSRSGLELMKMLRGAVRNRDNIYLMLKSPVTKIVFTDNNEVIGVETNTPNGMQRIGAKKVILADGGYGGNKKMVSEFIPEIVDAIYFGYEGNTGDAVSMSAEANAELKNMSAYQGHASVSEAHGLLVTWGAIMLGGFIVNNQGFRFGDESQGYSEYATEVLKQPEKHAYMIFDREIYNQLLGIEDFKNLANFEAFHYSDSIEGLAEKLGLNSKTLKTTLEKYNDSVTVGEDEFGRKVLPKKLINSYYGIKIVPALFHTQGGLKINENAQVLGKNGTPIPNLYAGGGSSVGISGTRANGYVAGNGLLCALGFGKIAGSHAAKSIKKVEVR
ncbi:flavocytochrome c [Bacillus salipaludis]|uniref:FAD-dependent oxidoreductase n=1 Tax=Bacillus salipaludis TaxID=2547811 RepID=UPI003D1A1C71